MKIDHFKVPHGSVAAILTQVTQLNTRMGTEHGAIMFTGKHDEGFSTYLMYTGVEGKVTDYGMPIRLRHEPNGMIGIAYETPLRPISQEFIKHWLLSINAALAGFEYCKEEAISAKAHMQRIAEKASVKHPHLVELVNSKILESGGHQVTLEAVYLDCTTTSSFNDTLNAMKDIYGSQGWLVTSRGKHLICMEPK